MKTAANYRNTDLADDYMRAARSSFYVANEVHRDAGRRFIFAGEAVRDAEFAMQAYPMTHKGSGRADALYLAARSLRRRLYHMLDA